LQNGSIFQSDWYLPNVYLVRVVNRKSKIVNCKLNKHATPPELSFFAFVFAFAFASASNNCLPVRTAFSRAGYHLPLYDFFAFAFVFQSCVWGRNGMPFFFYKHVTPPELYPFASAFAFASASASAFKSLSLRNKQQQA
jgi:hypothetical protein